MQIPIFNTYIDPDAFMKVEEVLKSTYISEGAKVKEFESALSLELGIHNPIAVNSGTSALHLALVLANIGVGDEVIIPAQTFVATGLVVVQQGARPVFADIQYETGNICPISLESKITEKTKAIIPVHWGGYPCDMDEIDAIAKKYNLIVIEDAAHAIGATYKQRSIGSLSDYTCFSFQAIKHLTTGDGGALACKTRESYDEGMIRRWFGIDRANAQPSILGERKYNIQHLGFKYHLNDFAAILGIANMSGLSDRLENRKSIANLYDTELSNVSGINLFKYKQDRTSSYWLYGFHVEGREAFIGKLKEKGITASVIHQRIDRNDIFGGLDLSLESQTRFDDTQIHIPIHDGVDVEKVNYIVDVIKSGW